MGFASYHEDNAARRAENLEKMTQFETNIEITEPHLAFKDRVSQLEVDLTKMKKENDKLQRKIKRLEKELKREQKERSDLSLKCKVLEDYNEALAKHNEALDLQLRTRNAVSRMQGFKD